MIDRFRFRAWNTMTKTMKEIAQLTFDEDVVQSVNYKENKTTMHILYQKHIILMQSTGLHAMENKLLYAGDLIRSPYDMELIKLVYWNQKETRFMCYMNDFMQCGLYQDDITKYKFEIVGNIFENWHLFRESKAEIDKIIDKYIWEGWEKKFGGENNDR